MARIAAKVVLSDKQEQLLYSLSNSRTISVHLKIRATIVLHCAMEKTNLEIMVDTGIHKKTISKWRNRWIDNKENLSLIDSQEKGIAYQRLIEKMLSDEPRCGAPSKFTAEQICLIINVSCESPEENDLPLSHWSLSSLADELVKRKIVDSISTSQLQVFLKSGKYKASQSKTMDSYTH